MLNLYIYSLFTGSSGGGVFGKYTNLYTMNGYSVSLGITCQQLASATQ